MRQDLTFMKDHIASDQELVKDMEMEEKMADCPDDDLQGHEDESLCEDCRMSEEEEAAFLVDVETQHEPERESSLILKMTLIVTLAGSLLFLALAGIVCVVVRLMRRPYDKVTRSTSQQGEKNPV